MKPLTKNNHFIPQFILKNFTNDEDKIFHFSKTLKDWKNKRGNEPNGLTTKKTAQQIHLYTTEDNGQLSDHIEQKFSHLEADVAPIVRKIITAKKRITSLEDFLSPNEMGLLMFFLTISLRRTPSYLKYINKHFIAALDTVDTADDFFEEADLKYVKRNKENAIIHNNFTIPLIFKEERVNKIMNNLMEYKWFIFSKHGLPGDFLLGDTLLSFLKLPIDEPENEVYVPLGKSHLLFGYKNNVMPQNSSILMSVDRHTVKKINEYIIGNADELVFSTKADNSIRAFITKTIDEEKYCNWECVFPFNAVFKTTHKMIDLDNE